MDQIAAGKKSGHSAVSVQKRMYPGKPVMRSGRSKQPVSSPVRFRSVDLNKPFHEPGNLFRVRWSVPVDLDGGLPKMAGYHFLLFAGFFVLDDPKLFGKSLVKKPVDQANKVRGANPDFPGFGLFE
jgi:hypothetical protein